MSQRTIRRPERLVFAMTQKRDGGLAVAGAGGINILFRPRGALIESFQKEQELPQAASKRNRRGPCLQRKGQAISVPSHKYLSAV